MFYIEKATKEKVRAFKAEFPVKVPLGSNGSGIHTFAKPGDWVIEKDSGNSVVLDALFEDEYDLYQPRPALAEKLIINVWEFLVVICLFPIFTYLNHRRAKQLGYEYKVLYEAVGTLCSDLQLLRHGIYAGTPVKGSDPQVVEPVLNKLNTDIEDTKDILKEILDDKEA